MADIIDVHIHEHIYTQTSVQALAIPILNADSDRITQPVLLDMLWICQFVAGKTIGHTAPHPQPRPSQMVVHHLPQCLPTPPIAFALGTPPCLSSWQRCVAAFARPTCIVQTRCFVGLTHGRLTGMRFGTSRESLHVKDLFTRYVRDEFLKSDLLHDVSFDRHSTAEEFHRACRHVAGKVIGHTLCRPVSASDVVVYLGRQQRHVQDFWQSTPLFDLPVMFIEVLEHTSLFV